MVQQGMSSPIPGFRGLRTGAQQGGDHHVLKQVVLAAREAKSTCHITYCILQDPSRKTSRNGSEAFTSENKTNTKTNSNEQLGTIVQQHS
jgi:hypothetical protein